ncbi:helix-turn-helix domain-containing protein [Streptomyces sp. NBC_00536]|uniref:helix-turn-helix domain-containing protein n=1 Tax=Streptomyces sp. NBC_00536 TaxID=2975769 RepID=UPI002E80CE8D|nr:helix-turn-helix domain-containing protein [Streptomyces sp. NBC_00536]WUC81908.1 helix-turn-helix domain-containing protein [Streptomyces sp. NBC_00536]
MEQAGGITPFGTWRLISEAPDARLGRGVVGYRGYLVAMDRPQRRVEVPNGLVTMVVNFAAPVRVSRAGSGPGTAYSSLVNGLRTDATVGEHDGRMHGVEVHLAPWMAFTLFGVPMWELRDRVVPLSDLLGPSAHVLEARLAREPGWPGRFALLDALLLERAAAGPAAAPQTAWAWDRLVESGGTVPLAALARGTGWSPRHLEQRFREQIGLSPKTAARVLRLQRALRMLAGGAAASVIASACGFYDQAHLHRDFRRMTGFAPGEFLVHRGNGARPVDRLPGQVTSALVDAQVR